MAWPGIQQPFWVPRDWSDLVSFLQPLPSPFGLSAPGFQGII